jgi:hypothetical protein
LFLAAGLWKMAAAMQALAAILFEWLFLETDADAVLISEI